MALKEGQRVCDMLRNRFCNKSCAAVFNNLGRDENKARYHCKWCGRLSKGWYCNKKCKDKFYIRQNKPPKPKRKYLADFTKAEVFAKNKTYASARSTIQSHARNHYKKNASLDMCIHCGYTIGIDVCHIRDVCDFPDTAYIREINALENMTALCKRHHHEFDNHLLALEEILSSSFNN